RPSGLTQAIIEVGRINKTLYLLNYIDDEDYRRRILTQLNRGEMWDENKVSPYRWTDAAF
ncbi:Tn3 family transposase, partial [Alcaligenes faecalis]